MEIIRPGHLVKPGTFSESERLRDINLYMVDEVTVPDRLEQPIGKSECENVLRWLLAEEVIHPEDLIFGKNLVQVCTGPVDEIGFRQQAHRRQGGTGRYAQIVNATTFAAQFRLSLFYRRFEDVSARGPCH